MTAAIAERPAERPVGRRLMRPKSRPLNGTKKRLMIGVPVDPAFHHDLTEAAKGLDRPLAWLCRSLLEDGLKRLLAEDARDGDR